MEQLFIIASVWLGMAVLSAVVAYHLRISIALVEICVGVVAAATMGFFGNHGSLGADQEWLRFLASSGAVLLTFLAGAELDPTVIRTKIKEVTVVGLMGFFAPFLGCSALAYYVLGWDPRASLLCGIGALHHFHGSCLCGHARNRPQQIILRQGPVGGLFCQ